MGTHSLETAERGLVRTQKEIERARGTHVLGTAEGATCQDMKESDQARGTHILGMGVGGTCQDTERIRPSKEHSLTGDDKRRDLSGHDGN